MSAGALITEVQGHGKSIQCCGVNIIQARERFVQRLRFLKYEFLEMEAVLFVFKYQAPMLDGAADRQQELIQFDRFQEKIQCAALHQIDSERSFVLSGQEDYLNTRIVLFDDVQQLRSGSLWHAKV